MANEKIAEVLEKLASYNDFDTFMEVITYMDNHSLTVQDALVKAAKILKACPEMVPVSERMPNVSGHYIVYGHGKVWISECLDLMGYKGWVGSAKTPVVEEWLDLLLPKSYVLDIKIENAIRSLREARQKENEDKK